MSTDEAQSKVRRQLVWQLLLDFQWHRTMEINAVDVGGSEGCRRVRELRAQCREGKRPGFLDIETVPINWEGTRQWAYHLVADLGVTP